MAFVLVTPAAELPIALEDARIQCQIDDDITDEDALIDSFIGAATDYCERYIGRPLITQEQQYLGFFSPNIELKPNLISVEAVQYYSESGDIKDLAFAEYYTDTASPIGRLCLLDRAPKVRLNHPQPVTINFICGYGSAADVPEGIKQCIRLLVGHWMRNRELGGAISGELSETAQALLNPYRLVTL